MRVLGNSHKSYSLNSLKGGVSTMVHKVQGSLMVIIVGTTNLPVSYLLVLGFYKPRNVQIDKSSRFGYPRCLQGEARYLSIEANPFGKDLQL